MTCFVFLAPMHTTRRAVRPERSAALPQPREARTPRPKKNGASVKKAPLLHDLSSWIFRRITPAELAITYLAATTPPAPDQRGSGALSLLFASRHTTAAAIRSNTASTTNSGL
ncbi:hypothetical protein B0G69_4863 [Paraburkholderia sp. RAU2J]|nr:hypothetical protein B0G69_4863 [Paraburkholderia sp. RAU2J]